jgi:hypothetical protein
MAYIIVYIIVYIKDARQRPRKERCNTQKLKCIIKRGVMPKI